MPMITGNFPDVMDELLSNLEEVIHDVYGRIPETFTRVFKVINTNQKFQQFTGIGPLGLMTEVGEAVDIPTDEMDQLYDKKITPIKYGSAVELTREVLDFDQFGVFEKRGSALATSAKLTKEIVAADVMDQSHNGSGALYQSADGVNIHASTHPIDDGASTASNVLSTSSDLSMTGLQNALNQLEQTVDDRGNPILMIGNRIIVPLALRFTAHRLLRSTDDPTTADRATNPLGGAEQLPTIEVNRYLTNTIKWYLFADTAVNSTVGWIWLTNRAFNTQQDVNIRNETAIMTATEMYRPGVVDWRGSLANLGT